MTSIAQSADQSLSAFYKTLPKVELHRHLEGSLRFETMVEVAGQYLGLPYADPIQLHPLVVIQENDPYTYKNFLSKFETIRKFYRSPEIIQRIAFEAIEDAARDQIRYMELRFTPVALGRIGQFPLDEVIDWVIESVEKASAIFGIQTRLIVSVNRHESVEVAEEVAKYAVDRQGRGIVAMDLAGDEVNFSALPFAGLFKEVRQAGLHITIHAGEWGAAANIIEAIQILRAERIGHGVRIIEDAAAIQLAVERSTLFEVCPTSNIQSGALPENRTGSNGDYHPINEMMASGLKVSLNTDDPGISDITLSDECHLVCEKLGMSHANLQTMIINAAQAAFLPEKEKQVLMEHLLFNGSQ